MCVLNMSLKIRFNQEVQRTRELDGEVTQLRTSLYHLQGEVQNYQGLLNNVLMCFGDVEEEVRQAHLFQVVQQHGPNNPIVVEENDETVADSEDECQHLAGEAEEEDGEIRGGAVFLTSGILVPIEDEEEDPREVARVVEQAEERAELMRCHLMMDDVAFWEAMELEQAARIDPVPGYQPALEYSEFSN